MKESSVRVASRWVVAWLLCCSCATRAHVDPALASRLGDVTDDVIVERIDERRLEDGTIQIAVTARSIVSGRRSIQHRTVWIDRAGIPIETILSSWDRHEVDGGAVVQWSATAPGPRAARYRVDIRSE